MLVDAVAADRGGRRAGARDISSTSKIKSEWNRQLATAVAMRDALQHASIKS